ncbi:hypothetical protein GGS26DRAFT_175841 [Hypomontagnella submonticulosa]|nr:hypothetical protein GGS26DRAFT_175841 [Hypomontagnella submonticulosa]
MPAIARLALCNVVTCQAKQSTRQVKAPARKTSHRPSRHYGQIVMVKCNERKENDDFTTRFFTKVAYITSCMMLFLTIANSGCLSIGIICTMLQYITDQDCLDLSRINVVRTLIKLVAPLKRILREQLLRYVRIDSLLTGTSMICVCDVFVLIIPWSRQEYGKNCVCAVPSLATLSKGMDANHHKSKLSPGSQAVASRSIIRRLRMGRLMHPSPTLVSPL